MKLILLSMQAELMLFAALQVYTRWFGVQAPLDVLSIPQTSTPDYSRELLPLTYNPLPLGSIRPTSSSWLEDQLHLSAAGLAGHLLDFYAYVHNSSWLGGDQEYSDLNEGFPYAFNGLVALAYSLPDDDSETLRLRELVGNAAGYVLDSQSEDGWLGPEMGEARLLWGRYPFLLGLTQLVEADSVNWEGRIISALRRFVGLMFVMLQDGGKGYVYQGEGDPVSEADYTWGRVRAADLLMTLQWLLEKYPSSQDDIIWSCMDMLYDMSIKWEAWYNEDVYIKEDLYCVPDAITAANFPYEHGVNVGQGLKAMAVVRRFTCNESLLETTSDAVSWTFQYHGAASGTILADERIDGLSPYTGSELCTVVETMFSLLYLYQSLGTNAYADLTELAAFNALPTMLTSDHWAHQYMAQPNQPYSKDLLQSPFFNSDTQAQTFGLEPNYPCCTVNHPQGLPKFLSASWVGVGDNGLAHALLSPSSVTTKKTTIVCQTEYPFDDVLEYQIDSKEAFDFYVRVPSWAMISDSAMKVEINNVVDVESDVQNGLYRISLPRGFSTVTYLLQPSVRTVPRANDSIAVYRGPILYALEIASIASSSSPKAYGNQSEYPPTYAPPESRDWTFTNTSAWNIAIDPSTLVFQRDPYETLPVQIYASGSPPIYIRARGCQIEWPLFVGSVPGAVPPAQDRRCLGGSFDVKLRPYGSMELHMAELPTIDLRVGYEQGSQ